MSMLTETCRPKSMPALADIREIRRSEREAQAWNAIMRAGARIWCQELRAEGIVRSPAWEHNAEPVVTVEIDGAEHIVCIRRVHGVAA